MIEVDENNNVSAPACIKTDQHITIAYEDGEVHTIYSSDAKFEKICNAYKEKNWNKLAGLLDPKQAIYDSVSVTGVHNVKVDNGVVYLDDKAVHGTLTTRMLSMIADGFDIKPMMYFMDNLYQNPSKRAVDELYGFLEKNQLPITNDGHFLAYKKVKDDYTDVFTGEIDNFPGAKPFMPRNEVDDDKNNTCSNGLHFCGRSYLSSFGGDRTIVLKINPKDVVSIPNDYDSAKGRCCKYEVIKEIDHNDPEKLEKAYEPESKTETPTASENPQRIIEQVDMSTNNVVATFQDADEASKKTKIPAAYITRVLTRNRQSTGGFIWRYKEDSK